MLAIAIPRGPQTESISGIDGIGSPFAPAALQAWTSGSEAEISALSEARAGGCPLASKSARWTSGRLT